jgi:alkylation response protein AidB-like acyl-CoA dehydrogenase
MFIVAADSPGLEIGPAEPTLGLRSALVTGISLNKCFVPGSCLLGDGRQGLELALSALQASRIGVAAQSVGIARGALGRGEPRHDLGAAVEAANLMMLRAAWLVDQGSPCPVREASMAKLFCSETAVRIAEAALAEAGPEACLDRHRASRYWRDARVTTIYGGPSEIQRGLIARQLLRSGK